MTIRLLAVLIPWMTFLACAGVPAHRPGGSTSGGGEDPRADADAAAGLQVAEACSFEEAYDLEWSGGMALSYDAFSLHPPDRFTMTRVYTFRRDSPQRCEGTLPACESPEGITVKTMSALLTGSVVRRVWPDSGSRLLGRDLRPIDGPLMVVRRESGGTLLLGEDCVGRHADCTPLPPEAGALRDALAQVASQISSSATCSGLDR